MAKQCPICGENYSILNRVKTHDGEVCSKCGGLCLHPKATTIDELSEFYKINQERKAIFNKEIAIRSLESLGFSLIDIDMTNRIFRHELDLFSFDQVVSCELKETVEEEIIKTKTTKKPMLSTAFTGTKKSNSVSKKAPSKLKKELIVGLKYPDGIKTVVFSSAIDKLKSFFDTCIVENQNDTTEKQNSSMFLDDSSTQASTVDEIRKYKQLFDDGIITEEEFNEKKKQLLNI